MDSEFGTKLYGLNGLFNDSLSLYKRDDDLFIMVTKVGTRSEYRCFLDLESATKEYETRERILLDNSYRRGIILMEERMSQ